MATDAERLVVLLEARIRDFEKNMQKASGTADRSYGRMRRESRSATRQMEADMSRASRRINQALASTSTQIGVLSRSFAGAFAGGVFAGGLAGLQRGVSNLLSEMSKIANVAKTVGMGTEDLQRLRYAFEQTGVAASETDLALRRFARRTGEAANGSGQLYEVLKANNVQLRNADGSMRSQMDLLRDYARLIQNAGSHQERLALAFKAFDVAGAGMVQGLMEDFDGFIGKIDEAGGAIDDELIQRAAELDTRMATAWSNFEKNAKSAILTVITFMDDLSNHPVFGKLGGMFALADFVKDPSWRNLSNILFTGAATDAVFGAGGAAGDPAITAAQNRVQTLRDQIENLKKLGFDATEAERELAIAQAELERLVKNIVAGGVTATEPGSTEPGKKTIIPGGGGSERDRAAEAALREQQAVLNLIDALSHELSLIGESDLEKAKANAIRQAGAAATDKQRENIEALVTAIYEETEALRQNEEAQKAREQALGNLFQMGGEALEAMIDGSMRAEEAVKRLAIQLALAAAQAALLGTGPLAGLFGGGGSLFGGGGSFPAAPTGVGLYASGTANTGGRRGEPRGVVHGQEAVIPLPNGGKVPVQIAGGAGGTINVDARATIDASGADPAAIARLEAAMSKRDAELPGRVIAEIRKAQKSNVKMW